MSKDSKPSGTPKNIPSPSTREGKIKGNVPKFQTPPPPPSTKK